MNANRIAERSATSFGSCCAATASARLFWLFGCRISPAHCCSVTGRCRGALQTHLLSVIPSAKDREHVRKLERIHCGRWVPVKKPPPGSDAGKVP